MKKKKKLKLKKITLTKLNDLEMSNAVGASAAYCNSESNTCPASYTCSGTIACQPTHLACST